jgi:hypothetical protein
MFSINPENRKLSFVELSFLRFSKKAKKSLKHDITRSSERVKGT